MFFSILIPVYNTSQYLDECMKSILDQTFTEYEVVLLNDGSTDNSPEICDKYALEDTRVRVIHKDNEGLMMTRRRGFKEAKGDYFICIDSDDKLYDKQALEKIHKLIIDTNCDLVIYNYVYGASEKREETVREVFDYPDGYVFEGDKKHEIYDKLLTTNYMNNIWIKCTSRNIVDIDTDYSQWKQQICRAEDRFQSFPMIHNAKRIAYLKDPLYYYRCTQQSISNNVKLKYYEALRCINNRADKYIEKWNVSEDIKERSLRDRIIGVSDIICTCCRQHKRKGTLSEWKAYLEFVANDPYYIDILNNCNKKKVLKYYRLLHYLIVRKRFNIAIAVITVTSFLSKMKKKIKK